MDFSIKVPKPCSEKWDSFTPTVSGGFCSSCNKTVTDFTKMSDEEVVRFFAGDPGHTCGRFRPDQLKVYHRGSAQSGIRPGLRLFQAGVLSVLFLLINRPASAQTIIPKMKPEVEQFHDSIPGRVATVSSEHTLRGVVTSTEEGLLPGVTVYLKGSDQGTVTDVNGQFEFPQKLKAGDVLVFSFIGFITREYVVPKEAKADIEMVLDLYYDITGEVAFDGVYTERQSVFSRWWQQISAWF